MPVTAVLQIEDARQGLADGILHGTLTLFPPGHGQELTIAGQAVPLESETSVSLAYGLADPAVWAAVARRIGVTPAAAGELKPTRDRAPGAHDSDLAAEAEALHARLAARAFGALGLPPAP